MSNKGSLLAKFKQNLVIGMLPSAVIILILFSLVLFSTSRYNVIVQNITLATEHTKDFKADVDYAMYRAVANGSSVSDLMKERPTEDLRDPYLLISSVRTSFSKLAKTSSKDTALIIRRIQWALDSLEDVCHYVEMMAQQQGHYDENMQLLDFNVYILTEIITEQILEYIYAETQAMESVRVSLLNQTTLCVLAVGFSFIISIYIYTLTSRRLLHSLSASLREFGKAAEAISKGDFSVILGSSGKYEELAILADSFNHMTTEIDMLIDRVTEEQTSLRNYEIMLYQAQINPHFLYNTLDSIVALIEMHMDDDAVRMTKYLSDFFRTTLSSGRDIITIEEEEMHIRSYLDIQKMRYDDIFDFSIEIDPEIHRSQIPKLTLQPLVENALYHGLKMKRRKGMMRIGGCCSSSTIILSVEDDGIGMDPEDLERVRESIQKGTGSSFGLFSIQQRIRLMYGRDYGLLIESRKGSGTKVTVRIPKT